MSTWDDSKIQILRENWGSMSAAALATKIGNVSRNAVIGKAHRLNLSAKIKKRSSVNTNFNKTDYSQKNLGRKSRKLKFRSLLLDKDFEPSKNLSLEELNENTCKYMEGHPNEKTSSFCGRKVVDKFSYCPLHMIVCFAPKNKKDEIIEKDEEVPEFIEKKIKSA